MINSSSKIELLFECVLIIYILHSVPLISLWMPTLFYAGVVMLLYICTLYQIGVKQFSLYLVRSLSLSWLLFLTFFEDILTQNGKILFDIYQYLQIVIFLIIGQYLYNNNKTRLAKHLCFLLILIYVITSITTYFGLQIYPGASRHLATTIAVDDQQIYNIYRRLNIGGFSFIYILVLYVPIFIGWVKNKVGNRFIGLFIIAVFLIVVLKSEYTTAVLLSFLSLFLFLANKRFNNNNSYKFFFILIVFFVVAESFLPIVLSYISNNIESASISTRLDDLSVTISNSIQLGDTSSDNDLDIRYMLIYKSWHSFLNSPFIGTWDSSAIGGHSVLLDSLALYGLLGLMGYCMFWIKIYNLFWKKVENKAWFGYFLFVYYIGIILSILNSQIFYSFLGFMVPVFMVHFKIGKNKNH